MTATIAFDLDGTLVDSAPDLQAAANVMLAERDAEALDLPTLTSFIGNGAAKIVERCLIARNLPAEGTALTEAMTAFRAAAYDGVAACHAQLYPGAGDAVATLAASHRIVMVTNRPEASARKILDHFGLAPHFAAVLGGDSLKSRKPDPEMLLTALDGSTGLMVGDSEVDAATAAAADIPFLLFTEGYRKSAVEAIPHRAAFDHFADLPGLVTQAHGA